MPTDNEIEIDQLARPMTPEYITIDDSVRGTIPTQSIGQNRETSMNRLIEFERLMSQRYGIDRVIVTPKKTKQKPIAKLLDEVSTHNKDIFDCVNKVQEEINTLEKTKLIELADKYDNLLFLVIGKNYTLVKATEKTKLGYYNTLTQQLVNTIESATNGNEYTLKDFKLVMLRHVSGFVLLDDVTVAKYNTLFDELYEYYNLINAKKKEKRCLIGREEKKETVCEDYINGTTSGTVRIILGIPH